MITATRIVTTTSTVILTSINTQENRSTNTNTKTIMVNINMPTQGTKAKLTNTLIRKELAYVRRK